jgi:hypothetical protein
LENSLLKYSDVPKDYAQNLLWRKFLWKKLDENQSYAELIWQSCKNDVLFYVNSFVWLYEPRDVKSPCKPFITYNLPPFYSGPYPYSQDEFILALVKSVEDGESLGVDKSRGVGATWMCLVVLDWFSRFYEDLSFLCLSEKEAKVDRTDDPDALFVKLDHLNERLPSKLQGMQRERTHMHVKFNDTRCTVEGDSTNVNAGRSGRKTAVMRDEEAHCEEGFAIDMSLDHATNCQWRISTPNGVTNSHHEAFLSGAIEWMHLHWSQIPPMAQGLYRIDDDGDLEILDEEWHLKHPSYDFVEEPGMFNGYRSPWYDKKVKGKAKQHIAQELDMHHIGAGAPFFDESLLKRLRREHVRRPLFNGKLMDVLGKNYNDRALKPLKLWFERDAIGQPPQLTTYTIGVDISTGTGASDSAIAVIDDTLKETVATYQSPHILPEDLADLTVSLCDYFATSSKPYLIWDGNGPGSSFGKRIMERHRYGYVYYHQKREERKHKKANRPGWFSNREAKRNLFEYLRAALANDEFITHSAQTVNELECMVYDGNGGVKHVRSDSEDASANKENHGDLAMAEALACNALKDKPAPKGLPNKTPYGCAEWRYRWSDVREQPEEEWF